MKTSNSADVLSTILKAIDSQHPAAIPESPIVSENLDEEPSTGPATGLLCFLSTA